MKVLLSWLREFAPFDAAPDDIAHDLSMLGMAVESMELLGAGFDGIVVGRVLDLRQDPEAKKIQRVVVDAGADDPVEVWCGAFNMSVGDLVPLATIGTVMPNGMEIGRRKILGQYSEGMLCSTVELGLGDDASGIMVLGVDAAPGTPLKEALGIGADVRYDLEITPNRPDAMAVAGIARDLAARRKLPFALPEPSAPRRGEPASVAASVEVVAPELCGRFTASVLRGVSIQPSPEAIARRLTLVGMRPINNVVDASNYVMLELGNSNHPYDLATLPGGAIRVRRARDGETLVTLDDVQRTLTSDDLLICDGTDRAIGIAGIMGGADTEISERTTDVLLETAWFQAIAIAKTARRLGLRTEASARFEKGQDPFGIDLAIERFAELLGAELAPGIVDVRGELPSRPPVRLRTSRVNGVLGTSLAPEDVRSLLEPIGFSCTPAGDDTEVAIPSFRPDCEVEIDLVEEVARHHGYDNIDRVVPPSVHAGSLTPRQQERRLVRRALVGLGLSEAMPMAFLAPGDLDRAGLVTPGLRGPSAMTAITITNPLVAEESVLRTSLLPGLLKAVAYNESHRQLGAALFEIGHVFRRPTDVDTAELPDEREFLAVALAGQEAPAAVDVWHALAELLDVTGPSIRAAEPPGLHPTRSAEVLVSDEAVGAVGEVDPSVLEAFGISERLAWLEVDLGRMLDLPHGEHAFRPFSRFPSSDIDLAFEVDDEVPAARVGEVIRTGGGELLVDLELFDVYRGQGVTDGRRSLAYRLRFQAPNRTLTDADVGEVRRAIIEAVQDELPARLRG
ncbi:MAG: phenylalanine--tRNA ligase subunit beta [Acidimicrobiales bacterium]